MIKKRILLTGATGTMGHEGLKQLCTQKDRFDIVILALPTPKDRKILKKYKHHSNITIVWGDLTNIEDVKMALKNVDIVLHVGALVSPVADHNPELAWKVNFGGTKNIVDILRTNKDNSNTKLVYIGTIAQTGNRVTPYHWGRIGDPLTPSVFDYYALSKINAERYIIESGISHWVSLRQTGIMHEKLMDVNDGIGYHMPLDNHLEWITAYDSGRLLFNVCSDNLPEQFWGNVYNIGGGESCRYTGYEFLDKAYGTMKVDFRKFENPNWYALRNFHGQYYYDSDKLNNYLNFRTQSVDDVFASIKKHLPLKMKILKFLPVKMVKKNMKKTALKQDTPLRWISDNQVDKIKAFFGSKEQWEDIPGWDKVLQNENQDHRKMSHGYDESKDEKQIDLTDLHGAAAFRGGKCLSSSMRTGDLKTKLKWECGHNHQFEASPYLILKTGHWCPECMKTPWNFDEQAKTNPFLAQVWYADHHPNENNRYQ